MRSRAPALWRVAVYLPVLVVVALIVVAHWPGRLDGDSLATIRQIRTGAIGDQYSAVLNWIWRQIYRVTKMGPGFPLLATTLGMGTGLYLVLRAGYRRLAASVLAGLLLLAPPTFGFVGLVGRDMWFVASLVLAVGLLVGSTRWTGRARVLALSGAWVMVCTAIAARQNGFAAALPVAVALSVPLYGAWRAGGFARLPLLRRLPFPRRVPRALAIVAMGGLATVVIFASVTAAARTVRDYWGKAEIYTQLYDLGYMSIERNETLIPEIRPEAQPVRTPQELEGRWLPTTSIFMRFDPARNFQPPGPAAYTTEEAELLGRAWREAVLDHPGQWLAGRFTLYKGQIGLGHDPWYSRVIQNQPNPWGYDGPANPGLSDVALDYTELFSPREDSLSGGPVHEVWLYLIFCLLALPLLGRRFIAPVRAAAVLPLAAIGVQVGLFLLAPSVQLRYELLALYAGLVSLCLLERAVLSSAMRRDVQREVVPTPSFRPEPAAPALGSPTGAATP